MHAKTLSSAILAAALILPTAETAPAQAPRPPAPPRPVPAAAAPPQATTPQAAPPAAPRPAAPDPAYEAARAAFEALPEEARRGIQDALVWTGDHNGVVTGGFGRRTFDAIAAWQRRANLAPSGLLDDRGRAALLQAGARARDAAGFAVRPDPATGAVIGVPERLLTRREAIPGGTRLRSADGKVTLDTRAYPPGETDLPALFERASAATPERKVTYKVLRPDFLVVSGETPPGKFFIRYAAGPAGIRGFTVAYDRALAKDFDRTVIAIANSFAPFPNAAAATSPRPGTPPGPAAIAAALLPPPRPTATGLAVAARRVLTAASALEGCAEPRAAGAPARLVARDRGLALLETDAARRFATPPLRAAVPPEATALVALAAAPGPGGVAALPAEAGAAGRLVAPLQPGGAGAPVLDRSGALVGIVASYPAEPRRIAGIVPAMTHPLAAPAGLAAFLAANGVTPAPASEGAPRTLGEITGALAGAVVVVDCARSGP